MERRDLIFRNAPRFIAGAGLLALGIRPEDKNRTLDIPPSKNPFEPCECTPASILQNSNIASEAGLAAAVSQSRLDTSTYSRENLGIPQDMLSKAELKEANIRIVQSTDTHLIMRRGIFDNQLFKDAKDGKLNEVVVVLVDNSSISWNASEKFPEDIKRVYQAATYMPGEREPLIDTHIKQWENYIKYLENGGNGNIQSARKELESVRMMRLPTPSEAQIEEMKNNGRFVGYHLPTSWAFHEQTLIWEKAMDKNSPRLKRVKKLLTSHPEVLNKVYVFVSVSGDLSTAHPGQSIPGPSLFTKNNAADPNSAVDRAFLYPVFPGLILLHEISHYDSKGPLSEYETDTKTHKGASESWLKFVESGYTDTSGYPFIFLNEDGITITQNQKAPRTPNLFS